MSIPAIPTIPTGSGGELFGAIRRLFAENADVTAVFGDRIHPGQVPPGTALPYIVLSWVGGRNDYSAASTQDGRVTYLNIWSHTFQMSVYAVGYESARVWGQLAHLSLDRQELAVDCYLVQPYVQNRIVILDPKRSEDGREVWHFSYRYDVRIPEFNPLDGTFA